MDETALALLEAAYKNSQIEAEGEASRLRFRASDAANALGLSTAARPSPGAAAYYRTMSLLENSGAVKIADTRGQAIVGETFYEITPRGEDMLREAGRIA